MNSFWPQGIDLKDNYASPYEIIKLAQQEWTEKSDGALNLSIQEAGPQDGIETLAVYAVHLPSNRAVALFTVIHREDSGYPAKITLKNIRIPNTLKKHPSQAGSNPTLQINGSEVKNQWICNSHSEFRQTLREILNSQEVTSEIVGLLAPLSQVDDDTDE